MFSNILHIMNNDKEVWCHITIINNLNVPAATETSFGSTTQIGRFLVSLSRNARIVSIMFEILVFWCFDVINLSCDLHREFVCSALIYLDDRWLSWLNKVKQIDYFLRRLLLWKRLSSISPLPQ